MATHLSNFWSKASVIDKPAREKETYSAYSAFSALLFETSKSTGKSAPLRGGRNSGTGHLTHSRIETVRFTPKSP